MYKRGYHYSNKCSSVDSSIYQKFITVWKHGEHITLEARLLLNLDTGEVEIDVFDASSHGRYAPYYLRQSYYDKMMGMIDAKIDEELKRDRIAKEKEDA